MDRDEELRAVWREQKTETTVMTSENVMSKTRRCRDGSERATASSTSPPRWSRCISEPSRCDRGTRAPWCASALRCSSGRGPRRVRPSSPRPSHPHRPSTRRRARASRIIERSSPGSAISSRRRRWYVAPFAPGLVAFTLGVGADLLRHGETMRAVASLLGTVDAIIATVLVFVLVVNRYATRA